MRGDGGGGKLPRQCCVGPPSVQESTVKYGNAKGKHNTEEVQSMLILAFLCGFACLVNSFWSSLLHMLRLS